MQIIDAIFGGGGKDADAARERDADEQLAKSRFSLFGDGRSSRMWSRPENAGLDDRAIEAMEHQNGKHIGGGRFFWGHPGRRR